MTFCRYTKLPDSEAHKRRWYNNGRWATVTAHREYVPVSFYSWCCPHQQPWCRDDSSRPASPPSEPSTSSPPTAQPAPQSTDASTDQSIHPYNTDAPSQTDATILAGDRNSVHHNSHNAPVIRCLPVPVSAKCTTNSNIHSRCIEYLWSFSRNRKTPYYVCVLTSDVNKRIWIWIWIWRWRWMVSTKSNHTISRQWCCSGTKSLMLWQWEDKTPN